MYAAGHIDHHFNGLLTDKIPLFRNLNWHMVAGANGFYIDPYSNYIEAFVGLENILKVFRVDFIWGYEQGRQSLMGLRIAIPGIFTGGQDD